METEVRILKDARAVRTYVSASSSPLEGGGHQVKVDAGGVHIGAEKIIDHRGASRLERLGAVLDSLSRRKSWTDPPRPLQNVCDLGHVRMPDGSVVVQAVHADGQVTTWSRGPEGYFQKSLRGLNRTLFGRAS